MGSNSQKSLDKTRFALSKIYAESISKPKMHHILNHHSTWVPLNIIKEKLPFEVKSVNSENINEILLELERMDKIRLRSADCEFIGIWNEDKHEFEHLNQNEVRNREILKLGYGIPTPNRGILYYLQIWHSMAAD